MFDSQVSNKLQYDGSYAWKENTFNLIPIGETIPASCEPYEENQAESTITARNDGHNFVQVHAGNYDGT